MMKTDDSSDFWSSSDFLTTNDDWGDFSIDIDALNAILAEDFDPPTTTKQSQSSPDDLSCDSFQANSTAGDANHERDFHPQNGTQESEEAYQVAPVLPVSSLWCPPEYPNPSFQNIGMDSECFSVSPGNFGGMIFDNRKLEISSHIQSPVNSCSASLTDWLPNAHLEHDIWSGERIGASMIGPLYNNNDSKRSNSTPSCSATFNFAPEDANRSLGYIDHASPVHAGNENNNAEEFGQLERDVHLRCPSEFRKMEKSGFSYENCNTINGSCAERMGSLKRNPFTSQYESHFVDAHVSGENHLDPDICDNWCSGIKSEDGIFFPDSFYGLPSTVTSNGASVAPGELLPDTHDFPFEAVKREYMFYAKDAVEDTVLGYQNICIKSKMDRESEEAITSTSVQDGVEIEFTDGNNSQGTTVKCESAQCSVVRTNGFHTHDASKQSLSVNSSSSASKKNMNAMECGRAKKLRAAFVFNEDVNGYCSPADMTTLCGDAGDGPSDYQVSSHLSAGILPMTSSREQAVCTKNLEQKLFPPRSLICHSVEVVQSSSSTNKICIDDDVDICILEDISDPAQPAPVGAHGKSLVTAQRPGFSDPLLGTGGTRLKMNDERLTFRVALQDLSQPKSEASPPDGVLAVPLLRHQRIALSWMVQKETSSLHCSGGILADDQGLGKTISTIALILQERSPSSKVSAISVKEEESQALNLDEDEGGVMDLNRIKQDRDSGHAKVSKNLKCENVSILAKGRPAAGTLVVCPTSVLRQWAEELHTKVSKEANLSVLVYHGSNRTKDPFELAKYDVVLTTYSIVSMEVPKQPLVDKDDDEKLKSQEDGISHMGLSSSRKRKYPPSSEKKNHKNKKGVDRGLLEAVARPLARVGWFRVVLDEAQSIKNYRTQVARACWGLRAKRRWCLSGTPIQNAVDDLYSYFRFLRYDPYAVYKSFCSTIKIPISRNPTNGYKKLQAVLKTIMLRRTKASVIDGEPIINLPAKTIELKKVEFSEEERSFYSQLEADSRAQFKVYAAAGTVKQNYVNILLMLLRLRQACDHPLLVKGYDSNSLWRSSVEVATKLPREKQMDLLNCLEACLAICSICNDPPEDAVVTICGHVFCNQCICEHLSGDDTLCPMAQCKGKLSVTSVFPRATLKHSLSDQPGPECSVNKSSPQLMETLEPCSPGISDSSKIKAALEVLQSLSKPRHSDLKDSSLESNDVVVSDSLCVESCKDVKVVDVKEGKKDELVTKLPEKAIVFSQWTRMLDLLEARLKNSSIQYRRLDGTMSVIARDKAVRDFNTLPEVTVIIMSLKAASLGLNMVAACHVLLLDLWWNPTTEDQAIDRAHRIGQTRPVTVLRLTVKDTVEDRILALQEKKRVMVASAFGEDEAGGRQTRLTVDDLKYLFMA